MQKKLINAVIDKDLDALARILSQCRLYVGLDSIYRKYHNSKSIELRHLLHTLRHNGKPLLYLAADISESALQLFISAGFDVNYGINGVISPIFIAAEENNQEVLKRLLAVNADPNVTFGAGVTAAYLAAQNGHLDILKILFAAGADINAPLANGISPLDVAEHKQYSAVITYLSEHNKNSVVVEKENLEKSSRSVSSLPPPTPDSIQAFNLPMENNSFVERANAFNLLNKPINVIAGICGSGKTALALKYAWKLSDISNIAFVLDFDNLNKSCCELLNTIYQSIYFATGISQASLCFDDTFTLKELKYMVNEVLAIIPAWILIFDNVINDEQLAQYLPDTMRDTQKILITSRNANWSKSKYNIIYVNSFTDNEALFFLKNIMPKKIESELKFLIQLVGQTPLALFQAATYISRCGITVAEYSKLYRAIRDTLWEDEKRLISNSKTFQELFFDILLQLDQYPTAKAILSCCVILSKYSVSETLFYTDVFGNEEEIRAALNILLDYSVVEISKDEIVVPLSLRILIEHSFTRNELIALISECRKMIAASRVPKTLYGLCLSAISKYYNAENQIILNTLKTNELVNEHFQSFRRMHGKLQEFDATLNQREKEIPPPPPATKLNPLMPKQMIAKAPPQQPAKLAPMFFPLKGILPKGTPPKDQSSISFTSA